MLSHRESFNQYVQSSSSVMTSEQISDIIMYSVALVLTRKERTARNTTELERDTLSRSWVKYLNNTQYSINTNPHSILEYKTPYRVLFGRDPVEGLASFGIPEEIAVDVTTEEEINQEVVFYNYTH